MWILSKRASIWPLGAMRKERLAILPLPSRMAIEPTCSQMPSSRASAAEVGDRRIALLGPDGGEQALALDLHQGGDFGRLHVLRALPGGLADQRAGVGQVLLHVAARAHLHQADAEFALSCPEPSSGKSPRSSVSPNVMLRRDGAKAATGAVTRAGPFSRRVPDEAAHAAIRRPPGPRWSPAPGPARRRGPPRPA